MLAPLRNIDENGILLLWNHLCEKCRLHCESYVHLAAGREQQHLLTDQEINELAYEINRKELYEILKVTNLSLQ